MGGDIDLGIDGLVDYKEIGSGGFATVYSALEVALDRRVAVKVLAGMDEAGHRRFDRERLSMGRTADHPNIVTPLRSGYTNPDSKPYLMMEYLAGGSLLDLVNSDGPLPWADAVRLILPIADALGFSHSSGVIHRDVKPANILLSRTGVVKLTDFGIAAIREATATSQVAFSLLYTAPETFDAHRDPVTGRPVDPRTERSDLYSLAATLYTLGAGHPPFESSSSAGLMKQIVTDPVPATGQAELDRFFAVAMAKDPGDRHSTAAQFTRDLLATHLATATTAIAAGPTRRYTADPKARPSSTPGEPSTAVSTVKARVPAPRPAPSGLRTSKPEPSEAAARPRSEPPTPLTGQTLGTESQPPRSAGPGPLPSGWWLPSLALVVVMAIAAGLIIAVAARTTSQVRRAAAAISPTVTLPADTASTTGLTVPSAAATPTISADQSLVTLTDSRFADSVAWSPDGRYLATARFDIGRIWDTSTNQTTSTLTGHTDSLRSVVWSPDGRYLATAAWDNTLRIWDANTNQTTATLGPSPAPSPAVWSPDGRYLATGTEDNTAQIWDTTTNETVATLTGHTGDVMAVAWSPDGRHLATASTDATARIWDTTTNETVATLSGHTVGVEDVAWSPDGRYVATAGFDHTARIWDTTTGQTIATLTAFTAPVRSVAWSPDGRYLATGGDTVQIWDTTTNETTDRLTAYIVDSLAWSPDGHRVAIADGESARIWTPNL